MGLWPECIEGETDFSCGIHFNIKGICPTYSDHLGLSDLDISEVTKSHSKGDDDIELSIDRCHK